MPPNLRTRGRRGTSLSVSISHFSVACRKMAFEKLRRYKQQSYKSNSIVAATINRIALLHKIKAPIVHGNSLLVELIIMHSRRIMHLG